MTDDLGPIRDTTPLWRRILGILVFPYALWIWATGRERKD